MKTTDLSVPEIGLIAMTRAILGFGIGLLIADRFREDQRIAIGWTAVAIGVVTTIPLAAEVFGDRDN